MHGREEIPVDGGKASISRLGTGLISVSVEPNPVPEPLRGHAVLSPNNDGTAGLAFGWGNVSDSYHGEVKLTRLHIQALKIACEEWLK